METVPPMPPKEEPARIRPPDAAGPMVDANCCCVFDESPMRGSSRRGKRGGVVGRGVTGTGSHELPSFRPCNSYVLL
jgi:hypothetical protein